MSGAVNMKCFCQILLCSTLLTILAGPSIAEDEAVDGLVGVVVGLLKDNDKDIRALAFEQIRTEAKGAAATKAFAAQLPTIPADAQVGLLRALAGRGDTAARPAIVELLSSTKDAAVKIAAIEAVGVLGEPADVELLIKLLASTSEAEQAAARLSLIKVRGEEVPKLIAQALTSVTIPTRINLIEILAERRGLDATPELLGYVEDADVGVRTAAMTALGQLATSEHLPALIPGVLKAEPGREREAAEKCVALVCSRIESPDQRAVSLLEAMDNLKPDDRVALYSTLGRVGGASAERVIEAAIASENAVVHEAGVRALCNWPDASVANRLIELATGDKNESLRIPALRALIRVAPLSDQRTDEERLALLSKAMTLCTRDEERLLVLDKARNIRTMAALHFIIPYLAQPAYAEQACLSVVEMAHHRSLRHPNKAEFEKVLDQVIQTSKDPVVVDRANRYKKDQTWVRPAKTK